MKKELTKEQIIGILRKELPYLRVQYGVIRLALYGSFAHGRPDEDSDVDLLVELSRPLGLRFVSLADYLEKLLDRKVDLATFESLRRSLERPRYRQIALNIQRTLTDVK